MEKRRGLGESMRIEKEVLDRIYEYAQKTDRTIKGATKHLIEIGLKNELGK